MKRLLKYKSNRHGYDGWALQVVGSPKPLHWTACTTRAEAREILKEEFSNRDFLQKLKIVKVKINLEAI